MTPNWLNLWFSYNSGMIIDLGAKYLLYGVCYEDTKNTYRVVYDYDVSVD